MSVKQPSFILIKSVTVVSATSTYSDEVKGNFNSCYAIVDVSAYAASQTLELFVETYDPGSAAWVELDDIAVALSAAGTAVYYVGEWPWSATGITESLSIGLPQQWRVRMDTTTADSITFSVGCVPIAR